jgi:hypothetical protein
VRGEKPRAGQSSGSSGAPSICGARLTADDERRRSNGNVAAPGHLGEESAMSDPHLVETIDRRTAAMRTLGGIAALLAVGCRAATPVAASVTTARPAAEPRAFDFTSSDRQFDELHAGLFRFDDARIEEQPNDRRVRIVRATALRAGSYRIRKAYRTAPNRSGLKERPRDEVDVFSLVVQVLPRGATRQDVERQTVLCVGDQVELQLRVEDPSWRTRTFAWLPPTPAAPSAPDAPRSPSCGLNSGEKEELAEMTPQLTVEAAFCAKSDIPDILGDVTEYVTVVMRAATPGKLRDLEVRVAPPGPIVVTPLQWEGQRFVAARTEGGEMLETWRGPLVLRPGDTFQHHLKRTSR